MRYLVLFAFILSSLSLGVCYVKQVCDSWGNCSPQQVCDNTYDIPSVDIAPIQPVVPPVVEPLPSMTLPPLGTTSCKKMRVCDSFGNCQWQELCQ